MINVWFGCRELTSPCTRFIYRHERTRRRHRAKKLKMDFPGTEFSSHAKMGVCMLHQCLYTKDTHINDNHTADRTQKTSRQRTISQVLPNIFRHIQHYSLHPRNISFIVIPIVYWRRQDLLLTCQFFSSFRSLSPLSLSRFHFLSLSCSLSGLSAAVSRRLNIFDPEVFKFDCQLYTSLYNFVCWRFTDFIFQPLCVQATHSLLLLITFASIV